MDGTEDGMNGRMTAREIAMIEMLNEARAKALVRRDRERIEAETRVLNQARTRAMSRHPSSMRARRLDAYQMYVEARRELRRIVDEPNQEDEG